MRKITLRGGFSGKVSTGSYENSSPSFHIEETIEQFTGTDEELFARLQHLGAKTKEIFDLSAQSLTIERIEKERKEIRFRVAPNGKKYPSVTSIIGFNSTFFVSDEDLIEYAAQGQINDIRIKHYIQTGEWLKPMDIPECWPHCHTLKRGRLGLESDACDFPAFLKKYPIHFMKVGTPIFNDEFEYCGEPDFIGDPEFDHAEFVPTVFDAKRSVDKAKNFIQMAAYAKCLGVSQMAIVPLNDKTNQGFSKPIVTKDVDQYFEMFLAKRREFRKRYGI